MCGKWGKVYKLFFRFNKMDFFIKKIFEDNVDDKVHQQFKKFSRGEFKNRAMIVAKNVKGKFRINTSHEYANEFVRILAEKLDGNKTQVKGVVISIRDLTGELEFQNKKQFMGVKQYIIDKEMTGNEILELCDKLPNSFIGFSFDVNGYSLKIKPKAPKSGKPSTKDEGKIKVDFCKLKTSDKELVEGLIFDGEANGFSEIEISHDFVIDEIIVSDELKELAGDDYSKIKEMAKRKGKIVRRMLVDGKEIVKEKGFEV